MPIQASSQPGTVLTRHFGVGMETIARWRHRDSVQDRPHTAHRLQTTLSPAQEAMVVCLRRPLLLPLDDLLTVTREFLCQAASRSGLDRCLRRHGVGNLRAFLTQQVCYARVVTGRVMTLPRWTALTHLFNHQIHHRG